MLLSLLSTVGNDKFVEHPTLGSVSCGGFFDSFKKCNELLNKGGGTIPIQCRSLYEISLNCYKKKTTEDFKEWLDEQIDEKRRLRRFLKEEQSILPTLQSQHMIYDMITVEEEKQKTDTKNEKMQEYLEKESQNNRKFF